MSREREPTSLAATLPRRLEALWQREGWTRPGGRVVVAVSGGLDSTVLLHLLRFPLATLDLRLVVAHFDHRMRDGSRGDLAWVRGLAGAWELPLRTSRALRPPEDEGAARTLRYRFLHRVREEGGGLLLTAHHARDQVETILFRALRGTGVRGLAGMPRWRDPGVLRPLLHEEPETLVAYARAQGIGARLDPTNLQTGPARNRIRHQLLPAMEEVHPGARTALSRLGRNARRASDALDHLLVPLLDDLVEARDGPRWILRRASFLAHPDPVQAELLRSLLRKGGQVPGESGTASTLEFIRTGASGTGIHLPGGVRLARHLDRLHLDFPGDPGPGDETGGRLGPAGLRIGPPAARTNPDPDSPFVLPSMTEAGKGGAWLGGRRFRVEWRVAGLEDAPRESRASWVARFFVSGLRLPLTLRRWEAGDRMRTAGGTKKLKKLFGELRVPSPVRRQLPVLADGAGRVIWVPGVAQAVPAGEDEAGIQEVLILAVSQETE